MTSGALAFTAGVVLLQQQAALPSMLWAALLPLLAAAAWFRPRCILVFCLAAGFMWAAGCAHLRMAERLSPELEGRDLELIGVVAGLPTPGTPLRFEFEVEQAAVALPRRLLLSWYPPSSGEEPAAPALSLSPGERWLLTVRLRRPHGQVNPQGFDYEAWLLERGIGATGYVRPRGTHRRVGHRHHLLDRVQQTRAAVRERFASALGAVPAAGILSALAVGDQRAISSEEWRLFRRTGVTHLMSISGLHVTMVSGLVAWLVLAGWRRVAWLSVRLPARKAAALAAIVAALGYTLLAGFAIPAQRTFYMVSVVAAALWAGRIVAPARVLALALAVVAACDPWAPLAPGFWLSFGAVALIFYVGTGWSAQERRLLQWVRVQWAITLGLAPATLLLFGQVPVAGPLANAVAIPLVSVVITPLTLLAALIPLQPLIEAAAWLVQWLLQYLEWVAALPGALWERHEPPLWSVALALVGVAWILAPRGVPSRTCGLALMAPALALAPAAPPSGEAWITTLDVGQGLAVVVRTARHTLLYDAGPPFGPDSDSGGRVVMPAMRAAGAAQIDLMVLTHEDIDHIGGALTVLESLPVRALASSLSPSHPLHTLVPASQRCTAGSRWTWDGVTFEFLHPPADAPPMRRNNRSCVLRVVAGGASMLLTGDIERQAELALLQQPLASDVLLVPHHGSRSSSSPEFISAVGPRLAVVAVGYRSRFGHPSAEVLQRYREAGVHVLRTDRDGAVSVRLGPRGYAAQGERERRPRYWRAPPHV